ncbi:MerR family transcriptional regulator [Clostridium sp. P21]|uniref:MerR family transcriptional regulator n=1 Tax=Clostridium muellerianum TaxID=2716538 RepID=A0A7Y0EK62_9CLOT|nr:MerR family transcriptional regulator [Clostridium muellerianum]NMM64970.1 MerR family transcriptional regulator [Clostridium muellerianum]
MKNKIYLSTGELAQMLGVTKQTVIYYDKIGLISPVKRGEKHYRYYTLEQADELDSILTFRNLGVPISVLKEYLSVRNAEGCIEMLKKQEERVNLEIQKLDKIRRKIEGRSKLLNQILKVKDFEKVEFSIMGKEWYMIEHCIEKDEKSYMQSFISICNRSKELQIDFENPICSIITQEALMLGNYKKTAYFGIKIPEDFKGDVINKFERPYGTYASTYHKGSYDSMYLSYERLIKGIKEQGYSVCGNAYEMDLLSTLTNANSDEYLKLIYIQVC